MGDLGSMDSSVASYVKSDTTAQLGLTVYSSRASGVRVPTKGSQCYRLLKAMQEGERLTIWNAMVDYGCGALHQRMNELRSMGWPIQRREVTKQGKRVAEFFMGSAGGGDARNG